MKNVCIARAASMIVVGGIAATLLVGPKSLAASAVGTARQVVIAAIAITNVSDIDFGLAAPGDATKSVAAGTSETATNGSFSVTGQPNMAYTITLPSSPVAMTTGSGGAGNQSISVTNFTSFPNSGANGLLNNSGAQSLYVGATRAALPSNQAPGQYVGTYTVTVIY